MTVEAVREIMEGEDTDYGNFPVGMRVLAVDDDPVCLKILEGLLRECKYHATTTSQARTALKMLRDNRDRFDLVISDVHMPDMDGFRLLELVGLEMDLPVIMLSANSDTKLVMKGITHGACDYLVKPIRIEELRNIWQHVIRRKKFDSKKSGSADQEKSLGGNGEGGQGNGRGGNADQNEKLNKRRKEDEGEGEDNGQENDDPSTQKKPRVVWSVELHRKFVAAVNQLGIEKAVPKRILDLMNVEGLTRENVASHLQKYRLYLKRISSVASQKAYMVAAMGGKDSPYLRSTSLDGFGDFRTLTGPGRLPNTAFSSYTQAALLGRLNSPAGVGLHNVGSSALVQPGLAPSLNSSISSHGKLQPVVLSSTQNASLFQGVPSPLELDHLQQNVCTTSARDFNPLDDYAILNAASAFTSTRPSMNNPGSSLAGAPVKNMAIQRDSQKPSSAGGFVNHSSVSLDTFNNAPFDLDVCDSTTFSNRSRCNDDWPSAVQIPKFLPNPLSPAESFSQPQLPASHAKDNNSPTGPHLSVAHDFSPTNAVSASLEDARVGGQGQEALGSDNLSMNPGSQQGFGVTKHNYSHSSGRSSVSASTFVHQTGIDRPTTDARSKSDGNSILGQTKSQGACAPQSYDSLDDLMNSFIKREQSGSMFDGDIPFDAYTFGSCM